MVLDCRLDTTISAASKQEGTEGGRLFKMMAKSFSKRYDYRRLLAAWALFCLIINLSAKSG